MPDKREFRLDGLAQVTRSVRESPMLARWFLSLREMPDPARQKAVAALLAALRQDRQPRRLIEAVELLAQPHFFQAVSAALDELK